MCLSFIILIPTGLYDIPRNRRAGYVNTFGDVVHREFRWVQVHDKTYYPIYTTMLQFTNLNTTSSARELEMEEIRDPYFPVQTLVIRNSFCTGFSE